MEKINNLKINRDNDKLLSGFNDLDKFIHSFEKSNLYILAGKPGMGKTTLGLNIISELALKQKKCVAVISYEMTEKQIISRLMANNTIIPNYRLLRNNLYKGEDKILSENEEILYNSELFIDCPAKLEFNGLRTRVKTLVEKNNLDFLLIDDIQRITISEKDRQFASNREQEVSKNVRDLKSLAKELNIPILAISQLNRNSKDRPAYQNPILTDIRDSGAIENDSDVIIFLHRPAYYGMIEDEEGNCIIKLAEIEIAKNRHGKIGNFKLLFEEERPSFFPYSDDTSLRSQILNNDNNFSSSENPF